MYDEGYTKTYTSGRQAGISQGVEARHAEEAAAAAATTSHTLEGQETELLTFAGDDVTMNALLRSNGPRSILHLASSELSTSPPPPPPSPITLDPTWSSDKSVMSSFFGEALRDLSLSGHGEPPWNHGAMQLEGPIPHSSPSFLYKSLPSGSDYTGQEPMLFAGGTSAS